LGQPALKSNSPNLGLLRELGLQHFYVFFIIVTREGGNSNSTTALTFNCSTAPWATSLLVRLCKCTAGKIPFMYSFPGNCAASGG
jgi:hypothetical protein